MAKLEKFVADNDMAAEALEAVVTVLRSPGDNKNKLTAAKTLLEYTQKKPVVANHTTLANAEVFLESLMKADDDDGPEAT